MKTDLNASHRRPGAPELDQELVVSDRRTVADDVVLLTLRAPDGGPLPRWLPGAHVDLVLDGRMIRQYSLCGSPDDSRNWQIAILREPQSRGGSHYVHDHLDEGQHVRVRGPRNNFTLVEAERYLFIAGGIGITPIRAMLTAAHAAGAEWKLLYGGRTRRSMAFLDELGADVEKGLVHICPQDEYGLLDINAFLGTARADTAVYSCGPQPLLAAVEAACASWPRDALHVERFHAAPTAPKPTSTFEVELRRTGKTVTVDANQSILDAVEQAGADVLSSCGEGTCGTCMVPVIEGTPDHCDSILTESERQSGSQILPCVSRSLSPVLVLDL